MHIANDVTELIGHTPMVRLRGASEATGCTVLGKCEFMNPGGSVKDRIGKNMVERALERGAIGPGSTIIEPTSGNTGVALAAVCAARGLRLILTMPESMSLERRRLLAAYGARLVLTPASEGMGGAIAKAEALRQEIEGAVILGQFDNPDNPEAHRLGTAHEILDQTDGNIDLFVAAVGTGGTLTGTSSVLKKAHPGIYLAAVEPAASPVLSGGRAGPHKIQGIGAGFVPTVLDTSLYDEVITIDDDEAIATARTLARQEGLLVGISSGANVAAAIRLGQRPEHRGKTIVTILCDTGERYLSTGIYD
jgi:cysteine synthase A